MLAQYENEDLPADGKMRKGRGPAPLTGMPCSTSEQQADTSGTKSIFYYLYNIWVAMTHSLSHNWSSYFYICVINFKIIALAKKNFLAFQLFFARI